jgi:diguanylate cyclase (GGDEF)-like protein
MRRQTSYALLGLFTGGLMLAGALAGHLLRSHIGWHLALNLIPREWLHFNFFYWFLTAESVLLFTVFGFLLGSQADRLRSERDVAKATMENLTRLAITDGLTGIYNRRYLREHLIHELRQAERYRTPLTVLMLDIDDFKTLNDTCGHPFGDLVLEQIAGLIVQEARRADIAGRYGGEEFLVIMPRLSFRAAQVFAERIRRKIADALFMCQGRRIPVTVSIGIASYPEVVVPDREHLIRAADEALYKAKAAGKNLVIAWQADTAQTPRHHREAP